MRVKASFWRYQAPAILWAMVIFGVSSIPDVSLPGMGFDLSDKLAHAAVYAVLGFLLARAFVHQHRLPLWRLHYHRATLWSGFLYGISDELHQAFVPGRTPDITDVLADLVGVWIGWLIFSSRHRKHSTSGTDR